MNASGLEGGTYLGTVNVLSNDPVNPTLVVNTSLRVIGVPQVGVLPISLAYGDVFTSVATSRDLIVANHGAEMLHVTDVMPSDATLSVSERVFDVAPMRSHTIHVIWTPVEPGAYAGYLTIRSNDANNPSFPVPVTGNGLIAPQMVTDSTAFSQTLHTGQQVTQPLTVYNAGGSNLFVNAAAAACGTDSTTLCSTSSGPLAWMGAETPVEILFPVKVFGRVPVKSA